MEQIESIAKDFFGDDATKLTKTMAGIEADQMLRQATQAENQGVRAAMVEQYKTRVTMSDATAEMAAGGAVLDPELLAKIKQRGDYNTMSVMFDARQQAIDLRYKAGLTRIGAEWEASELGRTGDAYKREALTGVAMSTIEKFWPTSASNPDSFPEIGARMFSSSRFFLAVTRFCSRRSVVIR